MAIKHASAVRKKPLKILLYGDAGVGKTHFALQATPGHTLIFDAESGADLFEGKKGFKFDYWTDDDGLKTASIRELNKAIDYLETDDGRKQYQTFIIDPISDIWDNIQAQRLDYKDEKAVKDAKKYHKEIDLDARNETEVENFNQRDWGDMKRVYKNMMLKLKNLPQNVILISREKEISETKPDGSIIRTGEYTFEAEKNTKYAVDFMIRLVFDEKRQSRYAVVSKSRGEGLNKGDKIDSPTFALFDEVVNNMADGVSVTGQSDNADENVFKDEDKSAETVEDLHKQVISLATKRGGSKSKKVMDIMKKYTPTGNPNAITDTKELEKLINELTKMEDK